MNQDAPAHSLIGASSMSRLIACPASFGLSQRVPGGGGSSIHAATGTVAHALAEESMTLDYDPATQIGEVVVVDGHEVMVDEAMVEAVRVYIEEVTLRSAGATWRALETRVCLDPYWPAYDQPPVSAFGTADTLIYTEPTRHLDVVDYKNGAGVFVDVTENPQLFYYAAGALLEVPGPVTTIDLVIVQPNVRGSDKVRVYKTTALDVLMWVEDVLKPTIREATSPGARISGGKHCRFCPARSVCPALATLAQDLARRDFGPSPNEPVVLSTDELGNVLTDAETVAAHIEGLREVAQAKIEAGEPVPGWSLVPTRPVRTWALSGPTLEAALGSKGFWARHHPIILYEPGKLRTPAQLEKLLSPEDWALVSPYVTSKSSGVKLVQDTSSGRATAQDDFA